MTREEWLELGVEELTTMADPISTDAERFASGERCHAHRDGDCFHKDCPQKRDGEPYKTGRSCPLWDPEED